MPPSIQTYHCICSTLLLASSHTLSALPRRSPAENPSQSLDRAIILPLATATSPSPSAAGYTQLLGLQADSTATVVRKEDGFERRLVHRCARCHVVVGYEIVGERDVVAEGMVQRAEAEAEAEEDGEGEGKEGGYKGRILYVLPGGLRTTEAMVKGARIAEEDVEIGARSAAVLGEV